VKSRRPTVKSLWPGVVLAASGASFLVAAKRRAKSEPQPPTGGGRIFDLPKPVAVAVAERRRLDERRRVADRREHDIDGVVGRVLRGSERRQVADRRSGSDRRARSLANGTPARETWWPSSREEQRR
jgi:hypothetical protein